MLKAIQQNSLIQKYSIQLLKYTLSGDTLEFWKYYDELLQLLGYKRIVNGDQCIVVKSHEDKMHKQYSLMMNKRIFSLDQLSKSDKRRYWEAQLTNSDQFQYQNKIYCVLTPLNYSINLQISLLQVYSQCRTDYQLSSYAFVSNEFVIYSNKIAQKKGIIKGLPSLLIKKVDPDTKIIEINKFSYSKFIQLFQIFKERYPELNLFVQRQQIHFILKAQQNLSYSIELLKYQLLQMIRDLQSINKTKWVAIASKNQLVCQIIASSLSVQALMTQKQKVYLLLQKKQIRNEFEKLNIKSLSGLSLSKRLFLKSLEIQNIKSLISNLWVLEQITSIQQSQIILETCIGFDHRQSQDYLKQKQIQLQSLGLNYEDYYGREQYNKLQQLKKMQKMQTKQMLFEKQMDLQSIKSQKINETKKPYAKSYKSQKVVSKDQKQLSHFLFGKKPKK